PAPPRRQGAGTGLAYGAASGNPAPGRGPAVVQAARRHRSPGAGEEQRPTSRQEARTVADQQGTHPRRHLLTHPTRKEDQAHPSGPPPQPPTPPAPAPGGQP